MSHQAVADSEQALTYPADAGDDTFLLAVRGTPTTASLEEARRIHNATAGAPQSVAGARSLGDLSHNVYAPYGESASAELLFLDFWNSLSGLGQFFQNKMVQEAASQLFASRDGVVWARATGFGAFHLTVPSGPAPQGVGLIRAHVTSLEDAAKAFRAYSAATINVSRLHGIVSHSQYTRVPESGRGRAARGLRRRCLARRRQDEQLLRARARLRELLGGLRRSARDLGLAVGPRRVGRVVAHPRAAFRRSPS